MVERAIIKLMTPPEESGSKEPYFECSWFATHPGDEIESKVILEMKNQHGLVSDDYSIFITASGAVVFIRWFASLNSGIIVVLHIFGENSAVVPVQNWMQYVLKYHVSNPIRDDELMELYHDAKVQDEPVIPSLEIQTEWLRYSLEGKELIIKENTSKEVLSYFVSIIETMPWTVYLLEFARISGNKMNIKFKEGVIEKPIPYQELFVTLTEINNNQFWNLTYKLLSTLILTEEEAWFTTIRSTLLLIMQITKEDPDPRESLTVIKDSIHDILDLDLEFGENYIIRCFSSLATQHPDYQTSKTLLELSTAISQVDNTDLVKLAEGTALQIAFMLKDPKKREEIFLMVTERSKIWGDEHLVGYIQSVTGILSDTEENRQILSKIVKNSQDQLHQSWDGSLCLVETNIVAGEFRKALEIRLGAVDLLTDKFMRAEDVITAVKWATKLEGLKEEDLVEVAMPRLGEAFVNIPIGDVFLSNMDHLLDDVIYYDRPKLLGSIITWFSTNLDKIGLNDRLVLLQNLEKRFSENRKYSQLLVQIRLTLFNHYLENPHEFGYEVAEDLLRMIYNNVDPSKSSSKELITTITRWILLASSRYNRPELIDEAKTRYTLLIPDKEFARRSLIDILARAAKNRINLPRSKLRKNGIGAKILGEILETAHIINDQKILLEIIPDAQALLLKKQAYMLYAQYAIMEMEILQSTGEDWLEQVAVNTKKLVEAGEIKATNILFDRVLSMDLTPEQEARILGIQLEYVELEPDLVSAEMIFAKRQRLIELQGTNIEDIQEDILLEHYRNGISELMSKGNVTHLNEFLLQAIVFCDQKNLSAIAEFSNILMDSFETNLEFYLQSKSMDVYNQLVKMFRQINSSFSNRDQTLPIKFANLLLKSNLDLYEKLENTVFLKRAQLISKEIGFVLREANMKTIDYSEEEKHNLMISFHTLLQHLKEKNQVFGTVDAALLASEFFYSINESDELFPYIDQSLALLKKGYVGSKSANSNIIFGVLLLSEIFLLVDGAIIKELNGLLQDRAIKLLDVGIASTKGSQIREELVKLKRRLIDSPQAVFQEFPFEIENFLQINDLSN